MRSVCLALLSFNLLICCFAKAPTLIEPKNPEDPTTLPEGVTRKVLVVGGGLAGLSAALELADRGYEVTIKESRDLIGGRYYTKPVEALNETFYVEGGFQAWFNSYHQFKDIRNRLGVNSNFENWPAVDVVFRNYKPDSIYSTGPFPLNLLGVVMRSPNVEFLDVIKSTKTIKDLLYYDFDLINEKYDNMTFREWATEMGCTDSFYETILLPSFNERTDFSAAEMLALQQIYFLTNAEADKREVCNVNHFEAFLKPWVDYLESKNTKIIYNKRVESLKVNSETLEVYGTVDEDGSDKTVYDDVILATDYKSVKKIFERTIERLESNDVKLSEVLNNCVETNLSEMKMAPEYKVLRVWFDKQLNADRPRILQTPDYTPVNIITQFHLLEKEYINWANKTGGSVIEFTLFSWSKHFPMETPDDKIWGLIAPTVKEIYPEIFEDNFKILYTHVNSVETLTSYQKGLMKVRPTVRSLTHNNLKNVFLAGDWIKTDYPSAFAERAVSTGREAANEILLKDNVQQASILHVNKKGPLA